MHTKAEIREEAAYEMEKQLLGAPFFTTYPSLRCPCCSDMLELDEEAEDMEAHSIYFMCNSCELLFYTPIRTLQEVKASGARLPLWPHMDECK